MKNRIKLLILLSYLISNALIFNIAARSEKVDYSPLI